MKILKRILLVVIILVALIVVIGFMFPANIHLERSIVINAPQEAVFKEINSLKNFNTWSPFYELDTTAKHTFEGPDEGVGSKFFWESSKRDVGSGSMTITESKPNELVITSIDLKNEGVASSTLQLAPSDGGTKMTWAFSMDAGMNPFARLMGGLMMDKMLGSMYEKGLNKLKIKMEGKPSAEVQTGIENKPAIESNSSNENTAMGNKPSSSPPKMSVQATTIHSLNYLGVRDTASIYTISQKIEANYKMIDEAIKKQKLKIAGQRFAFYYSESKTNWDVEVAIPTDKPGKVDGKVKPGIIKAGNSVVAHYFGDYMNMGSAYEGINDWIKTNNKKITGPSWEVYVTDPSLERDTAKWQTDIYFPIQ